LLALIVPSLIAATTVLMMRSKSRTGGRQTIVGN
jgi:hypothetical protein